MLQFYGSTKIFYSNYTLDTIFPVKNIGEKATYLYQIAID